jgi:hypothetical protein
MAKANGNSALHIYCMGKSEGGLPQQRDERRSSLQLCKNQAHELDDAKVGSTNRRKHDPCNILTQLQFFLALQQGDFSMTIDSIRALVGGTPP